MLHGFNPAWKPSVFILISSCGLILALITETPSDLQCRDLRSGQYYCDEPYIDPKTQAAFNCSKDTRTVAVACYPVSGLRCDGVLHDGSTVGFYKYEPCRWTNGKEFNVAVLLSIFLGWLGIDRFYLGYPAIGLVKFATVGFMLLGSFVDALLIALQIVTPADGSDYIVDYYGARLIHIQSDNYTYIKPPVYN